MPAGKWYRRQEGVPEIRLRKSQYDIFQSKARFKVVVAGRRFGKSFLAITFLLAVALSRRDAICYYVAPTYRMAKDIAWSVLLRLCPRGFIGSEHEGALMLRLINGSVIALKGADNPDSLRGVGLDACVLDEYADMDGRVWTEVVRPALSDRKGLGLFIGTPKGFNHFHDLYRFAQADQNGVWAAWQYTTADGGNVDEEEIEAARRDLPPRQFKQEYLASFEALTARVYYAFTREKNVTDKVVHDPELDLLMGVDFNINPGMHAVLAHKVIDQLHVFDEVYIPSGNTDELAREVVRRYGIVEVNGVKQARRLFAYPDPTGRRRQTSAPMGHTDFTILDSYGFKIRAPHGPYPMEDKINGTNSAFLNSVGVSKAFIHPRCHHLIKGLEGLTYKEDTQQPDKKSNLDHITDAFAYLACFEMPMRKRGFIGKGPF